MVPLKPAELNGERAGKKTGLSAGGSTLTAVGRLPAARVHRVCFLHSKRARAREAIFIGPLSQTHLSLSRRNVRRWHMAGSDIKGFICCCGAVEPAGPRAGAVNMQRNIITASIINSRLNRKVIVVLFKHVLRVTQLTRSHDTSRLCGGKAVTWPRLHATCYMLHAALKRHLKETFLFFLLNFCFILTYELESNLQVSSNLSGSEHNFPVVVCTQLFCVRRDY